MSNKNESSMYSRTCATKIVKSDLLFSAVTLSERMDLHAHYDIPQLNNKITHKIRK